MYTVEDLIVELSEYPKNLEIKVAVEVVEGHDVRTVLNGIEAVKFANEEVIIELG